MYLYSGSSRSSLESFDSSDWLAQISQTGFYSHHYDKSSYINDYNGDYDDEDDGDNKKRNYHNDVDSDQNSAEANFTDLISKKISPLSNSEIFRSINSSDDINNLTALASFDVSVNSTLPNDEATTVDDYDNKKQRAYHHKFKRSNRKTSILLSHTFLPRPSTELASSELVPPGNITKFSRTDRTIELRAYQPLEASFKINCLTYLSFARHPLFSWYNRKNDDLARKSSQKQVKVEKDENSLILVFQRIVYENSGFYFCRGTFGSIFYELKVVLFVYGIAEMSLKSFFPVYVEQCGDPYTEKLFKMISNKVCSSTGSETPFDCNYDVKATCREDLDSKDNPRVLVLETIIVRKTNPLTIYKVDGDVEECLVPCKVTRMKELIISSIATTNQYITELMRELEAACLPGTKLDQWGDIKQCSPCEKGFYQDKPGRYKCKKCSANMTTKDVGSVTDFSCRPSDFVQEAQDVDSSVLHAGKLIEAQTVQQLDYIFYCVAAGIVAFLILSLLCYYWPGYCLPFLFGECTKQICRKSCRPCYKKIWGQKQLPTPFERKRRKKKLAEMERRRNEQVQFKLVFE
ncbi:hypothetical protein HELRODRAFT_171051 [Helobdella robusta]|uniref:Ig-like domain-containing protein n=1 Tax=Helobdella robusta TaxID=6412 RepID=T1F3R3_HELRO|nr:hypothetical protein HELRODRAFT_171051 [Helobdella robusta]ESO07013.1 hypothetical protein HELRODRAFT_171051 [Helobdella robusta]